MRMLSKDVETSTGFKDRLEGHR